MDSSQFVDDWRRRKSAAFDLFSNSTARAIMEFNLFGRVVRAYANANLSVYSAQVCNAKCPFCVEELRPASRGTALSAQKEIERDDGVYFRRLEDTLTALKPLNPSVSITGGEPSKDPRLPGILRVLSGHDARQRTMTTNASGLMDMREGRRVAEWIAAAKLAHLNISRAHPDTQKNSRLMQLPDGLSLEALREALEIVKAAGVQPRLSCVLLRGETENLDGVKRYLEFAESLGVERVIFRQLMQTDPKTVEQNAVTRYSDARRAPLEPLLDAISSDASFSFQKQIVGYYYYVEVWKRGAMTAVFEEADLAQLERVKKNKPGLIHELIYHPNAKLSSTWQPWDGVLG